MIAIGSEKQLYIGGIILTALLVLGYNAFSLMSMFQPTILGQSAEAKLASKKWQQLDKRDSSELKKTLEDIDIDPILSKFTRGYLTEGQKIKLSVLLFDRFLFDQILFDQILSFQ